MPKKPTKSYTHAKYGQSKTAKKVFNSAKTIGGKDKTLYRQDPYGNIMFIHSHGKQSALGWSVDHIIPKSRGGGDNIGNLQALNSSVNISKGNTLVKKSRHSK
jgi:5-methylcytosine-specific restriction endonuclease McrA